MQVILLPGMDGTGILFEPLIKELGNDFTIRTISYTCELEQNYDSLAKEVRKQLPDQEEFILVAESFSGSIGYSIASNPPENLKAIVFIATFLTRPNRFMGLVAMLPLSLLLKLPIPDFLIRLFLLGKDAEQNMISLFRQSLNKVKGNVLACRVREMNRLKGCNRQIELPTVYISARNDKLVSKYHIEEFKHVAPGLEVIEVDGPHFIAQVMPKECATVIRKYAGLGKTI